MAKPPLKGKGAALGILILLVATYLAVVWVYFAEEGSRRANVVESAGSQKAADRLDITAGIIAVDLQKETVELRLDLVPHGNLAMPDGRLARALVLRTTGISGDAIELPAGQRPVARDVVFDLHSGEVTDYPFDSHHSLIEFEATAADDKDAGPVAAEIDFYAYHHGLDITLEPIERDSAGYIGFDATIQRSRLVKSVAIFCMLVMWGLALSSALVLWSAISHGREMDSGHLALLSGLIIALYFFRAGLPDTPATIGTLSDYLAFFWAEAIVSLVTIVYTWLWFKRGKDRQS
ncbi:MAG: DUF4436 family protein [Acidobacteria bacterium]|nr:DUF4436 family protein [Acidobacteriota bacterium]